MSATVLIVYARTVSFLPNSGDISVWITLHEMWQRGNSLYVDVWDHKDFGFLQINQFLYASGEVFGIYLGGALWAFLFAIGFYLSARERTERKTSAYMSCLVTILFVLSPSYLSVYVEPLAVSLTVLALGIHRYSPFASGFLFSIAMSVKISGILILAIAIAIILFRIKDSDLLRLERKQEFYRFLFGLGTSSILIFSSAYFQDALPGWYEISLFNADYASYQRTDLSFLNYFLSAITNPDPYQLFYFKFLSLFSLAIALSILLKLKKVSAIKFSFSEILFLGSAAASILVILIQIPIRMQHYQYSIGFLLAGTGLLALALIESAKSSKVFSKYWHRMFVVTYVVFALVIQNMHVISLNNLTVSTGSWQKLNQPTNLSTELARIPSQSNFMLLAGNDHSIDFRRLNREAELDCRLIYYFEHMNEQYGPEIIRCIEEKPNYIIIQNSQWLLGEETQTSLRTMISNSYIQCPVNNDYFQVWASSSKECYVF